MNRMIVGCVVGVGLMIPASLIVAETTLDSDEQKYSYALGYQIGSQIQRQLDAEGVELDVDAFARGITDVLSGRALALSQEEIMKAIETKGEQEAEKMVELGDSNESSGEAFRAEYGKQETVLRTDSGILYRVLTAVLAQNLVQMIPWLCTTGARYRMAGNLIVPTSAVSRRHLVWVAS